MPLEVLFVLAGCNSDTFVTFSFGRCHSFWYPSPGNAISTQGNTLHEDFDLECSMFRKTGWSKKTVLPHPPYADQILRNEIGSIEVRCTLKSEETKWSPPTTSTPDMDLHGLLYFNLGFKQNGRARLMSADVNIGFEDADGLEIVIVTSCAPSNALTPEDAPIQEISKIKSTRLEPQVEGGGFGAQLGSYGHDTTTSFSFKQQWTFHSNRPSVSGAEFTWKRNSPDDETGFDRSYDGALVLRRQTHRDILMRYLISIQAQKYIGSRNGKRETRTISLESGQRISQADFDTLTKSESLQGDVLKRNCDLAPTREISSSLSLGIWLTSQQAFQILCQRAQKPQGSAGKHQSVFLVSKIKRKMKSARLHLHQPLAAMFVHRLE